MGLSAIRTRMRDPGLVATPSVDAATVRVLFEYVVEIGKFTVRAIGPEDARLPHDARAKLRVSPRAVRIWPRDGGAYGGRAR